MNKKNIWSDSWNTFKEELPHQKEPFSKKNWGNINHSLCSYQGKLKPAIAYNLIKTFVPKNGRLLDPFSGVGTIPFEGALNGIESFGIDISTPAYYISSAKVGITVKEESDRYISDLKFFIENNKCSKSELSKYGSFGFNKSLSEYYEHDTFKEILLARRFFTLNKPSTPSEMVVISALLHILHGNRPYALSRRSHSIVPYAPSGEFIYKNLIDKLKDKVNKFYSISLTPSFKAGKIYHQDIATEWSSDINNLDAIITSPPFFDSTRFYLANWIRLWFCGWEESDFKTQIKPYIEERQKKGFEIYETIFQQSKDRLKKDGVLVLHLGKSKKCDMAKELLNISKKWFKYADIFDESVVHCESHGIKDKGTVTSHQYLILV